MDEVPRGRHLGQDHLQIGTFFGLTFLTYYLCLPQGGFADIPIQYLLKDGLKLNPEQVSMARLVIAGPTYIAFLFGFARDRWNLFGLGDRGIFLLFAPIGALSYGWLATGQPTFARLLVAIISATVAYRLLGAATQGLAADVGQRRGMTGRISTLWTIVWNLLAAAAYVIGGWVTDHLKTDQIFALLGALTMIYFAIGFWRPGVIFGAKSGAQSPPKQNLWEEAVRIICHKPIWPAAAIWLLWSFAPGFFTPLLFYLTDHVKATPTQFGFFNAIFSVSFLPTFVLYGFLCRFVSLNKLLLWGTVFAVPQMIPLLFLKTPGQALWLAVPIGLSGGVATAAYIDLLMRSCPKKLEGTGMMIADTGYYIAVRFGDLLGAWLYVRGGFALAAWITTGVYALILPLLFLVPRELTSRPDADRQTEERLVDSAA